MFLRVAGAIGFMLCCLAAAAEEPLQPAPGPTPPSPVPEMPAPEGTNAAGWLSGQVMLGQQLGIRGQATVAQMDHCTLVAEGFYGGLYTRFDSSESGGGGARALFRRTSPDGHNSMLFGPGLNLFYEFHDGGEYLLAPSVDLSWLHSFGCGGGWEIGLNAGLGVYLSNNRCQDIKAGDVTPLISIFTGLRF